VHVPDRRGRPRGAPAGPEYGLATEIEDLSELLEETGARNVFGLSSGAVIAIEAARHLPRIERLAVYEPPLRFADFDPVGWLPLFEQALAKGDTAGAYAEMVRPRWLPRKAVAPGVRLVIRVDGRGRPEDYSPLGELIPTMRQDAVLVQQATGPLERFGDVTAETLLMGGARSAAYLKAVLNGLEPVLPRVRRVTLPGVGHLAADNIGRPRLVADQLRGFFG
jgi:hypothetical protein